MKLFLSFIFILSLSAQFVFAAPVLTSETKLIASDAAADQEFGWSVAIDGDTAVVGGRSGNVAYISVRSGSGWVQQQKLTASDAAVGDGFGTSVAINGDTIVVGAPGAGGAGAAYVFVRSGGVWTEQQKLVGSDTASLDGFGEAVAVSGDTAAVSAAFDDDSGTDAGSAYIFTRSGATWTQEQKLLASDGAAGDVFGSSIAINGDTTVVGAYQADTTAADTGAAYVFVRSAGIWTQQQKLIASDAMATDYLGLSIAIDGDSVVAGTPRHSDGGVFTGAAYVFARSAGIWTEQQKLLASDATPADHFGWSVAIKGDAVVAGAFAQDEKAHDAGAAYLFTRAGGVWSEQQKFTASDAAADDWFGYSVGVSTNAVLVGSYQDDDAGHSSGSAYVYEASVDVTPPVITSVTATPNVLWPPNHQMVPVQVTITASDDSGATTSKIISVTSNESLNGPGDGNTSTDWEITGDTTVNLRAERSGNNQAGRIYTITVQSEDAAGNISTATVNVTVPKNQSK